MFPIRDHNPSNRTPFVTWALIIVNILIFISYFPRLSGNAIELAAFYQEWGLIPVNALAGDNTGTILSHMFLHGGWMHLIGNILFLYIFGDNLEDLMGHTGFLIFYLIGGLVAAGAQIFANQTATIPMVGASGAIAAVMGGYLLMFPRARIDILVILVVIVKIFTIPAWLMLGLWFALQLVSGLQMDLVDGGGVAYWAHAGGFIAGVVLALPFWLWRGGPAYWVSFGGRPPHHEVEYRITRRRSGIPRVRRVQSVFSDHLPLTDLGRVPRSGKRRPAKGPWTGGR